MVVRFVPKFTEAQIKAYLLKKIGNINEAVVNRLQRVGETFVNNARSIDTYKDITGNLRSSIGYLILKDGIQLFSGFPGSKDVGKSTGRKIAEEVAAEHTKGYCLIVVAGMDYAASVEARGKDVITGSGKLAEDQLKKAITSLQKKLA